MSALKKMIDNYGMLLHEVVDVFDAREYKALARVEPSAAAELAAMQARIEWLENERKRISDSIKVKTDAGEVPDNLADHVSLLMLQEYYPMVEEIQRLKAGE
mgnify:CR=1 FL=1